MATELSVTRSIPTHGRIRNPRTRLDRRGWVRGGQMNLRVSDVGCPGAIADANKVFLFAFVIFYVTYVYETPYL